MHSPVLAIVIIMFTMEMYEAECKYHLGANEEKLISDSENFA